MAGDEELTAPFELDPGHVAFGAAAGDRTSLGARWDDQGTATICRRIPNDDEAVLIVAVVMAAADEQVKKTDLPGPGDRRCTG